MDAPSSNPTIPVNLSDEPAHPVKVAGVRRGIARLLEYTRERYVAFPPHTTIELLESPPIIKVPGAPAYAHGLMSWQGVWLPMINLELLLHGGATPQRAACAPSGGARGDQPSHAAEVHGGHR